MSAKTSHDYVPGMCNIGPAERRMRRLVGVVGALVTVALLIWLLLVDAHWSWRLLLVIPASVSAMGFLQDSLHFCAAFGFKGIFNVINSAGVTDNVELEDFRKKDRRKAINILLWAFAIGLAVVAVSLLV